jgi:hypothetical protein
MPPRLHGPVLSRLPAEVVTTAPKDACKALDFARGRLNLG